MADSNTNNFSLLKPEIGASGHGPKLHSMIDQVDSALLDLFVMAQLVVIDKDLTAPPGSPTDRDVYIVAASATGAWLGHDGKIAIWSAVATAWAILTPANGWEARVLDENRPYRYDGSAWVAKFDAALHTKVVEIGDWNMDTVHNVSVNHDLDASKIRTVKASIRNDNDNGTADLSVINGSETDLHGVMWSPVSTSILLYRGTGGVFDNTNYDSTSYNRGWIIIGYTD